MDRTKLRERAQLLSDLLERHARDDVVVARCRAELEPLLRAALSASTFEPPATVPCARLVAEGGLAPWPDLDRAYSAFYVTLLEIDDVPVPE